MKRKVYTRILSIGLALSLVGCSASTENTVQSNTGDTYSESVVDHKSDAAVNNAEQEESTDVLTEAEESTEFSPLETDAVKSEEETSLNGEEEKKLAEQRNSFSMMYYLAIVAEEIRTSKDNRLVLEDIYTSLLNDINPGAVDEITQDHLKNLRDIIKSYLNISAKRERLQFIYNQEKASAMRNAVPNPLAILSLSNAINWRNLAITVAYTAVDSYNNYKRANESADMAFIMSGWELDDEEKETVMKNRDRAFDYMVDMVQEYKLDGLKTLNEKAIEKFAEISATENASEKIKLLRAEESTYSLLGNYWLELADAYFETSQYEKCLECVEEYNNLATGIYRKDFNYVRILPKAIAAAQEIYSGERYVESVAGFVDAIIENTSTDDWAVRYFAAQVDLDLYAKTKDNAYLDTAYKIASENVTELLKEQRTLNDTYLSDVVQQTAVEPDYRYMTESEKEEAKQAYKDEEKRIKDYNNALKEKRKTELPALYEPLILNCELLFALADKLNINENEKAEILAILGTDTNGIFLVKPINDAYSFGRNTTQNLIELSTGKIMIPADLLTDGATITAIVTDDSIAATIDDWVISKVEREGTTIDTFKTYVSSDKWKKYKWTADSKIELTITYADAYEKTATFEFAVGALKEKWFGLETEVEFITQ